MDNMFDYKKWMKFCRNSEEMREWQELMTKYSMTYWESYAKKWENMFSKVEGNLKLDPQSAEAQKLFDEWMDLVNSVYGDYPELKKRIWDFFKSGMLFQIKFFNQSAVDFMDKVSKFYKK